MPTRRRFLAGLAATIGAIATGKKTADQVLEQAAELEPAVQVGPGEAFPVVDSPRLPPLLRDTDRELLEAFTIGQADRPYRAGDLTLERLREAKAMLEREAPMPQYLVVNEKDLVRVADQLDMRPQEVFDSFHVVTSRAIPEDDLVLVPGGSNPWKPRT